MNRLELQALSKVRLAESKALLKLEHPSGAYYLAGYSVECALKAVIAKRTIRHDFPDKKRVDASYTHDLKTLVKTAGLEASRIDLSSRDTIFADKWVLVSDWSEQSRYSEWNRLAAESLIDAISQKRHGVMAWLIQHW